MTSVPGSPSQYCSRSLPERSALLPVETNDDRPRPRRAASATAAIPNAPLCEANATCPGVGATGAKRRVEADVGGRVEHAEAVRADEPHARGPAHGQQLRLARRAGGADLGEAGREDDERPHAGGAALARDLHDGLGLDGDDGQLDRLRHVGDRVVGGQVAEGPAARMHDGEPAAIARRAQVPEHRGADRAGLARDADHRDRRRPQHVGRRPPPPRRARGPRIARARRRPARPATRRAARPAPSGRRPRSRSRGTPAPSGGSPAARRP